MITHRERVLTALSGKETDRPPVDLGGLAWSIVDSKPYGYRELCRRLQVDAKPTHRVGSYVVYPVDEMILRRFDVDFRHIRIGEPKVELPGGTVEDCFGVKWVPTPSESMYYPTQPPLASAQGIEGIEEYEKWPNAEDPAFTAGKAVEAKALREGTDCAIMADLGVASNLLHRYAQLRGFSQWLLDMRLRPELYEALVSKIFDANTRLAAAFLSPIADLVDVVCISDDMGSQASPFVSQETYRLRIKPWLKRRIDSIRVMAPRAKILYHTCGSVHQLIPELIDSGVDILNPLQPLASGMDPRQLKVEFGESLCLHGGIDIQRMLPFGGPEEVKAAVRGLLGFMGQDGGYIMAPSHQLQADIPAENIVAMYDAARLA
jgi:uroporphyrinogen decarboxylase